MIPIILRLDDLVLLAQSLWELAAMVAVVFVMITLIAWAIGAFLFCKRVHEMEVAIVFNTPSRSFSRFLKPGLHWLKPWERIESRISTAVNMIPDNKCEEVHVRDGLPFTIFWGLAYRLDPLSDEVKKDAYSDLARLLPHETRVRDFIKATVNHCLRLRVGECVSIHLYRPKTQLCLEEKLKEEVSKYLASRGIKVMDIMLGSIHAPKRLEEAFEQARKHQVEAEGEAKALNQLDQELVRKVKEEEMKHLEELERIHALGEHGVALPYQPGIPGRGR